MHKADPYREKGCKKDLPRLKEGMVYHIKDEYYALIAGCHAKEKMGGQTYPACCCRHERERGLYWMIPMSTKIEKYRRVLEKEAAKYGECLSVVMGWYDLGEVAFQIQGMLPVTPRYILHPHTRQGRKIPVEAALLAEIQDKFDKLRRLAGQGAACVLTDIARMERLLLSEL